MLINHGTRIIHGLREKVNLLFSLSITIPNMHVFNSSLNFTEIQIRFVHLEMISIFVINQIPLLGATVILANHIIYHMDTHMVLMHNLSYLDILINGKQLKLKSIKYNLVVKSVQFRQL